MALSLNAQTVPSRFQGKPVKMKLRIHSKNVQAAAKASSLGQLPLKKRQNRAGKAANKPKKPPLPAKHNGISQPRRGRSIISALLIQKRPQAKWPKPNQ